MPLYDYHCSACDVSDEVFVPLADYDPKGVPCPDCGALAKRGVPAVLTVGPMPSKPLTIKQIGRSFESNGELRRYKSEHPEARFVEPNSSEWRNHVDATRAKCEATAKKHGFRDHDHRRQHRKDNKNKSHGANP
jgi:putative FmdB family regulatory protein